MRRIYEAYKETAAILCSESPAPADRIVVFDRGRIAPDGTHKELLREGGIYGK